MFRRPLTPEKALQTRTPSQVSIVEERSDSCGEICVHKPHAAVVCLSPRKNPKLHYIELANGVLNTLRRLQTEERRVWPPMPYERLALKLLETNCELEEFDVDFMDADTSKRVAIELERLGCRVEQFPHKSKIHVVCPEPTDRAKV